MKDRKTICGKANDKIKKLLTGEPTDDFQKEIQERLKNLLRKELEFMSSGKSADLSDEEIYNHFDTVFTDIIDRIITKITSKISYCEAYDIDYPYSLEDINFADIGLANWFEIITDIHSKNVENKLGIYRFSVKDKADLDKIFDELFKLLSED